jgi:hypothetical protein
MRLLGLLIALIAGCLAACSAERGRGPGTEGKDTPRTGSDAGVVMDDDRPSANRGACEAYVSAWNALPCTDAAARLDAVVACPDTLDATSCDATEYFDCLATSVRCQSIGGVSLPDAQAIAGCGTSPCTGL